MTAKQDPKAPMLSPTVTMQEEVRNQLADQDGWFRLDPELARQAFQIWLVRFRSLAQKMRAQP